MHAADMVHHPSAEKTKNCFPVDEHAPITFLAGLDLSVETYPKDSVTDPKAYLEAIAAFLPGDAVTIFTPDDTHFEIALAAIQRGE
jgi:predicted dehydrogenase